MLMTYCENIGIDFDVQMLNWEDGRLKKWNPHESEAHKYFHDSLNHSKKINPPTKNSIQVRTEHLEMVKRAVNIYEKLTDNFLE